MIGSQLGHYRIEKKLGEGGMGVVYQARDTHLDRLVAIKVLGAGAVSDPDRKRRFIQEARTASALNHPNIIHIYDIDQSGGIDFMAMELVAGTTLDRMLGERGLPVTEALDYAIQIAGALARAHEAGIVHRDLKPVNVMVTPEGLVKVLDFGLAKLTEVLDEKSDSDLTATLAPRTEAGVVMGTVEYMSPEQAEGKKVDARSDIFSFGAMLYEVLSGKRPFRGDSKLAILSATLSQEPVPLREFAQSVPPEVDRIVSRCLRKQPADRFQSMGEVKAALEAARGTLGRRSVARSFSRRKWLWASLAALAMLAAAIPFAWRGSHTAARRELVAILPFETTAAGPDGQAFAEGFVEILGRELSSLNQFQQHAVVLPRQDVHGNLGPADVRSRLGADLVLSGTLQESGQNLRCGLKLVDTRTSEEVRRLEVELPLRDAAGWQRGLVKKAAALLKFRVTSRAEALLAAGGAANPEAYQDYLQGYGYLQHPDRAADVDRANALFQKALQKDPSFGRAYAGLGESFWAKSLLTQDKEAADKARANLVRAITAKADLPEVRIALGEIYSGTGRPREAVEQFRRALELDPFSIAAHTSLGDAYQAIGQVNDSEIAYRALIGLWPNYLVPYSHLAAFYVRQGRYKEAEPVFRKVIELAPDNASGYQNLGAVYHLLGRPDDAAAMMKKSLSIRPTARGYTNLGTLYFFEGRYSDAVPLMEKAVEMDPGNYVYWGNLGDAYRWAPEQSSRAAEAYRQAIKLARQAAINTKDAELKSTLAGYYAKLPDYPKALAEIAEARRLAPMNPKVLFKAALVYEITGRRQQALGALDLALQNGYSADEVRQEPELAELRKDARYKQPGKAAAQSIAKQSP